MNRCGDCTYYVKWDGAGIAEGYCHRLPPTVFVSGFNLRPKVRDTEAACGEHKPGGPTLQSKRQPATHGDAVKDAQQAKPTLPKPTPAATVAELQRQQGRRDNGRRR